MKNRKVNEQNMIFLRMDVTCRMSWKKRLPFATQVPLESLIRMSGKRLLLPFYHAVSDEKLPHIESLYPVRNIALFRQDLEFLCCHFEPIDLETVRQSIHQPLAKPAFHLTFDDGLREMYEVVAPILKEMGIPASFFVNSAFVGNQDLFFRYKVAAICALEPKTPSDLHYSSHQKEADKEINEVAKKLLQLKYEDIPLIDESAEDFGLDVQAFLENQQPYMTLDQLKSLANDGFTIGAHSIDHPEYRFISLKEQLRQTEESLRFVEEEIGGKIRAFAFPFTDFGVQEAWFTHFYKGNEPLLDVSFGTAGLKEDVFPQHFQRVPMEGTLLSARQLIHSEYLAYLLKRPLGKHKIRRT